MSAADLENIIESDEIRKSEKAKGLLYLLLGTLLFSLKGIFIKLSYEYSVTPTQLMTLRMIFALPLYVLVLRQQLLKGAFVNISPNQILISGIFGLFGYYLASWLDLSGLMYLPASLERLILYTYPSMVLVLSVIFLGQKLTVKLLFSLLIVYLGLFVVFAQDIIVTTDSIQLADNPYLITGVLLVLASALSFSIFFVGSDVMLRLMPSKVFTSIAMISASIGILVHFNITNPVSDLTSQASEVYFYALIIAIFCTVIPSFLIAGGIKRVGAATGSIVSGIGPIVTLIFATVILGELITFTQALGFAIVIGGLYYLSRNNKKEG